MKWLVLNDRNTAWRRSSLSAWSRWRWRSDGRAATRRGRRWWRRGLRTSTPTRRSPPRQWHWRRRRRRLRQQARHRRQRQERPGRPPQRPSTRTGRRSVVSRWGPRPAATRPSSTPTMKLTALTGRPKYLSKTSVIAFYYFLDILISGFNWLLNGVLIELIIDLEYYWMDYCIEIEWNWLLTYWLNGILKIKLDWFDLIRVAGRNGL